MTNREILRIALEQSAVDCGCAADDFLATDDVVCEFCVAEGVWAYIEQPRVCNLVSYGNNVVGFAGCSADCERMWQIGVDVLPGYRHRGIAAAVTNRLARETFARGKVPFYCAVWSNVRSERNALASGFKPAWVEASARPMATDGKEER